MEAEWIFGIFFLSLAVGIAIRTMTQPRKRGEDSMNNEALEIAKKRYAKGELSEKEFERIRSKILSLK